MLLLLNTTKTMDASASVPSGINVTEPDLIKTAQKIASRVSKLTPEQLAELMSISDKLAIETHEKFSLWAGGQSTVPALFGFTGLIFKHLDPFSLNNKQLSFAQKKVRVLSGLYGLLAPFDLIKEYRLEMGYKLSMGRFSNLAQFWKTSLTDKLNKELPPNEPIVSVASQEYMKALDIKKLNQPVIMPVFKEKRADGRFKNAVVHAKKARGAIVRYAIEIEAKSPKDLMGFSAMGWKADTLPPDAGAWLFSRPAK